MRLKVIFRSMIMATLFAGAILAQKSSGGGGKPTKNLRLAGAISYSDNAGDAVMSDLGGDYTDGVDGTECGVDFRQENKAAYVYAACTSGPTRSVAIEMGTCIAGSGVDPFGGAGSGLTDGEFRAVAFWFHDAEGQVVPLPGETVTSSPGHRAGYYFLFRVNGEAYRLDLLDATGAISGTGFDDDGDGLTDRVVMTIGDSVEADLYNIVYTEQKLAGRNGDTYYTEEYVYMSTYTGMGHSIAWKSFDYLRGPTRDPFNL